MLRWRGTFWCADCEGFFEAETYDWRCRCITVPAECPECGSWHTLPDPRSDFDEVESFQEAMEFYRPIWKREDEERSGCTGPG